MTTKSFLHQLFDFYINASLHVALATTSLVQMTFYFCKIPFDPEMILFVFCGTCVSYNTIKYLPFVLKYSSYKPTLQAILGITSLCLLLCVYLFFCFNPATQWAIIIFGILCALYVIPFSKSVPNLRNLAGIKIYIVSTCWAGVTLVLPVLNAGQEIDGDILYKFLQRFILTLILILIFEIYDLKYDSSDLKTVPQTIGIKKTKWFIYSLLVPFYVLEFCKKGYYPDQWFINLLLCVGIALFTYFVNEKRSKYYTVFWVESIPVIWLLLVMIV